MDEAALQKKFSFFCSANSVDAETRKRAYYPEKRSITLEESSF
jgi:hypothetical protein